MTIMIKPDDIPDDVVVALRAALEKSEYLDAAIAASINAWPGFTTEFRRDSFMGWNGNLIILPLPQEVKDE